MTFGGFSLFTDLLGSTYHVDIHLALLGTTYYKRAGDWNLPDRRNGHVPLHNIDCNRIEVDGQ